MISVCVAVYLVRPAPNVAAIGDALDAALDGQQGELVVALNGVDAAAAAVPPAARTVDLSINRGVAPAWNAAAREATGDVLVFCNDDVELGTGSLALLADVLRRLPNAGVVGPSGSRWDVANGEHRAWVPLDDLAPGDVAPCEVVSGFLFACRRSSWEAVGGFDEFYAPASFEEVDFCTAVRAAGAQCFTVAGVRCAHAWGVSRHQMPWARARWDGRSETWRSIHRRNRRHFLEKWGRHPIADVPADALAPA